MAATGSMTARQMIPVLLSPPLPCILPLLPLFAVPVLLCEAVEEDVLIAAGTDADGVLAERGRMSVQFDKMIDWMGVSGPRSTHLFRYLFRSMELSAAISRWVKLMRTLESEALCISGH